jgi:hypothetical protein
MRIADLLKINLDPIFEKSFAREKIKLIMQGVKNAGDREYL